MKRFSMTRSVFFSLLACLLLAACSEDQRDWVGLGKEAPNEYRVISRPPLTLPPEYHLRPPRLSEEEAALKREALANKNRAVLRGEVQTEGPVYRPEISEDVSEAEWSLIRRASQSSKVTVDQSAAEEMAEDTALPDVDDIHSDAPISVHDRITPDAVDTKKDETKTAADDEIKEEDTEALQERLDQFMGNDRDDPGSTTRDNF